MRLYTRNNLDGVVSAALVMKREPVKEVLFVHPKQMQDGEVEVMPGDAITNLPLHPNAGVWFDHHTAGAAKLPEGAKGTVADAPSASRLVYEYYDFYKERNHGHIHDMVHYTDRMDSAILTYEDVLRPDGWILLGFMLDPRTGLNLDHDLYRRVIYSIRDGMTIREILSIPDIEEAKKRYLAEEEKTKIMLTASTRINGSVIIQDLRGMDEGLIGNRFFIYAIFPRCTVSIRIMPHERDENRAVVAVGKSIFHRVLKKHIGELMAQYGGGGLAGAGSAPFDQAEVDERVAEIAERLQE
ncbi:exopolyphosphatase [bacterium]|nr:exopolyphosphatase [bacterium]